MRLMQKVPREELPSFVRGVLGTLPAKNTGATFVALSGELGAGKTTFVQTLAKELGVKEIVQSPTYVLMKRYDISYRQFRALIHIDLYRLEKPEELVALQLDTVLNDPHNLICIEWPERAGPPAGGLLPKPDLAVKFSSDGADEGERYIEAV